MIKDIFRHLRPQKFTSFMPFVNKLLEDMLHEIKEKIKGVVCCKVIQGLRLLSSGDYSFTTASQLTTDRDMRHTPELC